jgi:hypothetical protein
LAPVSAEEMMGNGANFECAMIARMSWLSFVLSGLLDAFLGQTGVRSPETRPDTFQIEPFLTLGKQYL